MTAPSSTTVGVNFYDDAIPSVEYHEQSETYRTEFDFVTWTVSDAVITAVAYARECDPLELPPLFRILDPDALDSVFAPLNGGRPLDNASVVFEYADYIVTVNSHGTVELKAAENT